MKKEKKVLHILRECEATRGEISIEEFLNKEGKGQNVMKKINEWNNMNRKKDGKGDKGYRKLRTLRKKRLRNTKISKISRIRYQRYKMIIELEFKI